MNKEAQTTAQLFVRSFIYCPPAQYTSKTVPSHNLLRSIRSVMSANMGRRGNTRDDLGLGRAVI